MSSAWGVGFASAWGNSWGQVSVGAFDVTVPYLIGYTEAPARAVIEGIYCTPSVVGSGGTVAGQAPDAFTTVPRGTTVTVTMGGAINSVSSGRRNGLPPYHSGSFT